MRTASAEALTVPARWDTRTIVGLGVSLVSVAGCVWWASSQKTPAFPSGVANWSLLVAGVVLYGMATLARGWRWDTILRFLDVGHQRADAYALNVVGYMGNTVLPARGGEVLRMFLLSERSDARKREVAGSVISERLLDAGALVLLFVVVVLTGIGDAPGGKNSAIPAGIALVLAVGGAFGYLQLRRAGRFGGFADRIRPFARASRQLLSPRGAGLFAVTLAVWLTEAAIFSLCAHSLGLSVSVLDAVAVTVLASLSALIPAGPGYVGTFDAAALFALHRLGVTGGAAVGCILLYRFVIFVPVTCVGLILMVARYGGIRGALRREHAAERQPDAAAVQSVGPRP